MIPVQDLCVGNWVYDGNKTRWTMFIRGIGEDYVYLDFPQHEGDLWESWPKELQGIPLTEELLKKIGFEDSFNGEKTIYSMWFRVSDKRHINVNFCLDCGSVYITDTTEAKFPDAELRLCSYATNFKFLHELQNFVYMTTKQRLKIEL